MGADVEGTSTKDASETLAKRVTELMHQTDMPNGNGDVSHSEEDVDTLTERASAQQRLVKMAPMAVDKAMISEMFRDSLKYW